MTRIYINYDMFRHRVELCDMMRLEKTEKGGESNAEGKKNFGESKKSGCQIIKKSCGNGSEYNMYIHFLSAKRN